VTSTTSFANRSKDNSENAICIEGVKDGGFFLAVLNTSLLGLTPNPSEGIAPGVGDYFV
jgi:hypothetical protein